MAYSTISSEKTNNGFLYKFRGTSEDTKPTGKWVGENSEFYELDTGNTYFFDNPTDGWVLKAAEGGSSGGSYTLPTASASTKGGVKIGSGLSMDGEVLSATGGGAEKFVVTLTNEDDPWTADKTLAEIIAAYAANKTVVCAYTDSTLGVSFDLPCTVATNLGSEQEPYRVACFGGDILTADSTADVVIVGNTGELSDSWGVNITPSGSELPPYSVATNGQVLGVDDGDLAWVDNYAPLIVTMASDGNDGLVGNKTFSEIATAANANKPVLIKWSDSTDSIVYNVVSVYAAQEQGQITYQVSYIEGSAVKLSEGSANDYFVFAS